MLSSVHAHRAIFNKKILWTSFFNPNFLVASRMVDLGRIFSYFLQLGKNGPSWVLRLWGPSMMGTLRPKAPSVGNIGPLARYRWPDRPHFAILSPKTKIQEGGSFLKIYGNIRTGIESYRWEAQAQLPAFTAIHHSDRTSLCRT